MTQKNDIGLIGLAVMGANLARNIARNGFKTVVYNRTTEKMTKFIEEFGSETLVGEEELKDFVDSLSAPRKIIIMVKAGKPVDALIEQLIPFLDKNDILIDCGNSHYPDSIRRENELKEKGFHFIGCGVSGGEEGALNGPSIMPGGDEKVYETHIAPIFEKIAAKDFNGGSCVTWIGEDGAGHYVKMVHNGIEYAVMQMLAEVYDILRKLYKLPAPEIGKIFERLHSGKLESFLTEISIDILKKEDDLDDGYLIDKILDKAGQKGTGKWTAIDAAERSVAAPSISEAVNARIISSQKDLRKELDVRKLNDGDSFLPLDEFLLYLEDAVSAAMLSAYAQGYDLIVKAAKEKNWSIDLSEISRIWQGGCIIRAKILGFLQDTFQKSNEKNVPLLTLPEIGDEISHTLPSLRLVTASGILGGVPLPALSSALSYLDGMRTQEGSANFIQGLRDFFGAHTFERKDRAGTFHANWHEDNS